MKHKQNWRLSFFTVSVFSCHPFSISCPSCVLLPPFYSVHSFSFPQNPTPLWVNFPHKHLLCQPALWTKLPNEPLALASSSCHLPSPGPYHLPPCLTITWILSIGLFTSDMDAVSLFSIYLQFWLGISLVDTITGPESLTYWEQLHQASL